MNLEWVDMVFWARAKGELSHLKELRLTMATETPDEKKLCKLVDRYRSQCQWPEIIKHVDWSDGHGKVTWMALFLF
ncbi:hypothetical protein TWF730_006622 [Orbilia blumenaviensis]|uniref:Uncharacterized protein n=1 Tax=Orbilia blumenaviensis TaxID=1796055 RepID=A0AAV9VES7_9PEZI